MACSAQNFSKCNARIAVQAVRQGAVCFMLWCKALCCLLGECFVLIADIAYTRLLHQAVKEQQQQSQCLCLT